MEEEVYKKSYEISFLVRDESAVTEVLRILKEHGAEISLEGSIKNIALAYPIEKIHHAHFGYFHCVLFPDKVMLVDKDLRTNKAVLRFLIVTPPLMSRVKETIPQAAQEREVVKQAAPSKTSLPLSNEELEKKIDEILQ